MMDRTLNEPSGPLISLTNGIITGGSFTQHNHRSSEKTGFDLLREAISPGAFHNSGERFDPPKCHPNTRTAVLQAIVDWIIRQDPETRQALIMWLHGAAGAGKSAIAQTIAEISERCGFLLASFFFSRTDPRRNNAQSLFATIAYQIATVHPQIRHKLSTIIEKDPMIFTRSLEKQFSALIIEPFEELLPQFQEMPHSSHLVIIDGLDECSDSKVQCRILDIILTGIRENKLPLIFLIASRPEHDISSRFNASDMDLVHTRIALDDKYLPAKDIERFLRDKFTEIAHTHPFKSYIPTPWPADSIIRKLVDKSSGQFIYASTVIKYVESSRHRPDQRLDVVLDIRPARGDLPFAELDSLYTHIFSSVDAINSVLLVLACHASLSQGGLDTSTYFVRKIFSMEYGDVEALFCDLSAVVDFNSGDLRLLHASLIDFLSDKTRAGRFYINDPAICAELCHKAFQYISRVQINGYIVYHAMHITFFGSRKLSETSLFPLFQDDIPSLPFRCIHQYLVVDDYEIGGMNDFFQASFIPWVLELTKKMDNTGHLYANLLCSFDEFLGEHLPAYYSDMTLTLMVAMVDFCVNNPQKKFKFDKPPAAKYFDLAHLSLHDWGQIGNTARRDQHMLIHSYLVDPKRAKDNLLDGVKYATAALCCIIDVRINERVFDSLDNSDGLCCLIYFLSRANRSEELIEHCRLPELSWAGMYSYRYPELCEEVNRAIQAYLTRVDPQIVSV